MIISDNNFIAENQNCLYLRRKNILFINFNLGYMKLSLLLIVSFFSFLGCKSDSKPCFFSKVSLAGTYKITAELTKTSAGQISNSYSAWADCKKDDLYTFNSNGIFSYAEGVKSCSPGSEPYSKNWSLLGSTITLGSEQAVISDFTCSSFKFIRQDAVSGSTITSTYSRQ